MKKGLFLTLLAVMLLGTTNVQAMSKDELKTKLTKAYTINGETFQATSAQKTQIERYLNQNDVSSDDAEYISGKVDEIVALIEKGDATSVSELTRNEKDSIIAIVNDISNKTSVKATILDGELIVYNSDGTLFTKVDNVLIKQTNSNNIILMSSLVSLVGLSLVARKLAKANA